MREVEGGRAPRRALLGMVSWREVCDSKIGPNATTKRKVLAIAVAAFGVAALAGCMSGTSKPEPAMVTASEARAYYLAAPCKVDASADLISAAINIAERSYGLRPKW